mgnify:FL=1
MEISAEVREIIKLLEVFKIIKPVSDLESELEKTILITDRVVDGVEDWFRVPINDLRGDHVSLHWFVEFINGRINNREPFPRRYSAVNIPSSIAIAPEKEVEIRVEKEEEKRKSLRDVVSKIFLAQPLLGMRPGQVSEFLEGNFNAKIEPAVVESYLLKNDINSLIDYVVDEMIR